MCHECVFRQIGIAHVIQTSRQLDSLWAQRVLMILKEKFTLPAGIRWFILTGTQASFSGWLLGQGLGHGGF